MSEIESSAAPPETSEGGGTGEIVFAVVVCALVMFLPILLIEHGYQQFTEEHGLVREGAAGAALALAVVLRTVSRTVMRTVVRTSARAGLRAGVKGAVHGALRVATRNLFASFFKTAFGDSISSGRTGNEDASTRRRANLHSLFVASVLLYASWVIVIGFGQPFSNLMTAEQAATAQEVDAKALAVALANANRQQPDITAWELDQRRNVLRDSVMAKRKELKGARDLDVQNQLANELSDLNAELTVVQTQLSDALIRSGDRMTRPNTEEKNRKRKAAAELERWLFTRAPYPGPTPWNSPLIWGGAVLFVLPLWLIYFVQSGVARRIGVRMRHETGADGGLIQIYFAGALSFMPLSSDVVVEGTTADRGRVSLAGLVVPTMVSIALWLVWKLTGGTMQPILLASDAFLIYPMVQCFPLTPLDGNHLFRWHRGIWFVVFAVVMAAFIFMGSEGLKNVI
jgi:hypothetical protein